jgi:hypothetical protein
MELTGLFAHHVGGLNSSSRTTSARKDKREEVRKIMMKNPDTCDSEKGRETFLSCINSNKNTVHRNRAVYHAVCVTLNT